MWIIKKKLRINRVERTVTDLWYSMSILRYEIWFLAILNVERKCWLFYSSGKSVLCKRTQLWRKGTVKRSWFTKSLSNYLENKQFFFRKRPHITGGEPLSQTGILLFDIHRVVFACYGNVCTRWLIKTTQYSIELYSSKIRY